MADELDFGKLLTTTAKLLGTFSHQTEVDRVLKLRDMTWLKRALDAMPEGVVKYEYVRDETGTRVMRFSPNSIPYVKWGAMTFLDDVGKIEAMLELLENADAVETLIILEKS